MAVSLLVPPVLTPPSMQKHGLARYVELTHDTGSERSFVACRGTQIQRHSGQHDLVEPEMTDVIAIGVEVTRHVQVDADTCDQIDLCHLAGRSPIFSRGSFAVRRDGTDLQRSQCS